MTKAARYFAFIFVCGFLTSGGRILAIPDTAPNISDLCPQRIPPGQQIPIIVHGTNLSGSNFSIDGASIDTIVDCGASVCVQCPSTLPPGTHTLTATNPGGASSQTVVIGSLEGLSVPQMIGCLAKVLDDALVAGCITKIGIHDSLKAKLTEAVASFLAGHLRATVHQLEAFVEELEAQSGKAVRPKLAFVLATVTQDVIIPRIPVREPGRECKITCDGEIKGRKLLYDPTDLHFATKDFEDPVVSLATVEGELVAPLKAHFDFINDMLKCPEEMPKQPDPIKPKVRQAAASSMMLGPTFWTSSWATASLNIDAVSKVGQFIQTAKVADNEHSLIPLEVPENPKGKTEKNKLQGTLFHEIKASVPKNGTMKIISYATVHGLATADSIRLDHIPPKDSTAIKVLRTVILEIIKLLPIPEAAKKGIELVFDALLGAELEMKTTCDYDLKFNLNGNRASAGSRTEMEDIHNEAGKHVKGEILHGKMKSASLQAEGNPDDIKLTLTGTSSATAYAVGKRGSGTSLTANMWAFAEMMCCEHVEERHHARKFSALAETAAFVLSEKLTAGGRFKLLLKFNDVVNNFLKIYNKETEKALKLLLDDKCEDAKKVLEQMHQDLSDLLDKAEQEAELETPPADKD